MKEHNKISVIREYCLARRIPYKINREALYIDKHFICYSIYNLTYIDMIQVIDKACIYDSISTYYIGFNPDF